MRVAEDREMSVGQIRQAWAWRPEQLASVRPRAFRDRVDIRGANDCWLWTGQRLGGYGVIHRANPRRNLRASRLGLRLLGIAVPETALVCHACDNPPCVNPGHLFIGSQHDNMRDAAEKGRVAHRKSRAETIELAQAGLSPTAIAERLGVHPNSVTETLRRAGVSYRRARPVLTTDELTAVLLRFMTASDARTTSAYKAWASAQMDSPPTYQTMLRRFGSFAAALDAALAVYAGR